MTRIEGPPEIIARLADAGIRSVADVLEASTCTRDLPDRSNHILEAAGLTAEQRTAAFETLAGITARLHDAGLHHRDLYLCHIFMRFEDGRAAAALIDLERLGTHRRPLGRRVVKDLAAIRSSLPEGTTTPEERRRFLARYLELRGLDPDVLDKLHRRVRRKAARIRAHVPRTPVGEAARPKDDDA